MTAFYACKDERNLPLQQKQQGQDIFVQVTSADAALIQKQLTWIAKGLAGISDQSSTVKYEIHTLIETTDYFIKSNEQLEVSLHSSLGYDYDQEVDQWLQTNQPGNDYDPSYFFDIDIDDCPGKVGVLIPEADIADQAKLHVVTPSNPLVDAAATLGYYISSIGILDSLTITEDNMDSVYLWIVGVGNNCGEDTGFTESTPPPRLPPLTPPSAADYTLTLKSITFNTDSKNASGSHPGNVYQEGHLAGRYEIHLAYGLYDVGEFYPWRLSAFTNYNVTTGVTTKDARLGKFHAWGKNKPSRNVIKRYNGGSGKSNRGGSFTRELDRVLVDEFYPDVVNIVLAFYEYDASIQNGAKKDITCQAREWAYTYSPLQHANVIINTNNPGMGGPLDNGELSDNWLLLETDVTQLGGPLSPTVPAGIWVSTSATTYQTTLSLDGEMTAILTLTENP